MYFLDYKDNNFTVSIQSDNWLDRDDYMELINYLKVRYLGKFSPEKKCFICDLEEIQEIILWFDKDKVEYKMSSILSTAIQDNLKDLFNRELRVNRGEVFDTSVIRENEKAFDYQLETLNRRIKLSSYLDAYDAGTGKTPTNIWVFSHHYKHNNIDAVLILAPTGMSFHWKRNILRFSSIFTEDDIGIVNNENKNRPYVNFKDKKIIIVPVHLFADTIASYRKDYDELKTLSNIRWKSKSFVDLKKVWGKEKILFLIDESHSIKNTDAIRTKAVFHIKKQCEYRIELTATPWINKIEDCYSLLTFIDQSIIPMSEKSFHLWLGNEIGDRHNPRAIVSYNTERVKQLMESYQHVFFQKLKEDLPEIKTKRIMGPIYCEMHPIQFQLYRNIVQEELHLLTEEYDNITWRLLESKFHLMMEVFDNPLLLKKRTYNSEAIQALLRAWKIEIDPKFIILKEKLNQYIDTRNEKVIVFDTHPDTIDLLAEKFKQYKPIVIHGQLKVKDKEKDRQEKEDLFNYDPERKLIILSQQTSSQGINLQHGGHRTIFYTLSDNSIAVRQAIDRTFRADSKVDSIVEMLTFPDTIDNIRYLRSMNNMSFNDKLDKELTQEDLEKLLNGRI